MFLSSISLQERPKTSFTQGPIRNESVKHLPYQLINKDKVTTVVSSFDGLPFTTSEHVTQKRATAQHIYGSTQEDEEIIVDYEPSHEARGRAFISTLSQEKQDQGWPQTPIKNIQQDMCHQTELTNTKKIMPNELEMTWASYAEETSYFTVLSILYIFESTAEITNLELSGDLCDDELTAINTRGWHLRS